MSSGPTNPDQVLPDDVTALILAAGEGSRLGQSKAFLAAYGKTLLERAVAAAQPFAAEMIVGVPAVDVAKSETLVGDSATVKAGGETRQETLETILALATRPLILLHEVARPMVPAEQFEQVLIAAAKFGAACPCIAASRRDPLAIAESGFIDEGLSRENVVRTQIPQAYQRQLLIDTLRTARENKWQASSVTSLCAQAGYRVRVVSGDRKNIKITYDQDWEKVHA